MTRARPASPPSSEIAVGDALPPFELPVTSTVIVAGAIASRDFMPAHHDRQFATGQGAPDMFMNIMTTNGYVSRFVTDWAGPESRIASVAIRLGTPNLPGDTMTFSGSVKSVDAASSLAEVEVTGANAWGNHVTGTVTVELPGGGS
jgi:acyl dehydratase